MKTRNITLLTAIAAAAALAPTAQAAITATGNFDLLRTQPGQPWLTIDDPNPGDWKVDYFDGSLGAGTLNVAGGSLFYAPSHRISVGWGGGTSTITVTGDGSELRANNGFSVGINTSHGDLIVEAGGLVDVTGGQLHIGQTGLGTALVTGANSKLTTATTLYLGQQASGTGILTVEDSGLVQASGIQFGWDSNPNFNSIHMGVGGVLAVLGDKTGLTQAQQFSHGGLFTIQGTVSVGEIRYNPSGDDVTWVNMTGATEGSDYTLEYQTSGDLNGYTVLTMLDTTTPAADPEITSIVKSGDTVTVEFTGEASTTYVCKRSTTLSGFSNITFFAGSLTTDVDGDATFTVAAADARRFYLVAE